MNDIQSASAPRGVSRRTVLRALGGVSAGMTLAAGIGRTAAAVPRNPTYYQITIDGATTHQQFRRVALLLVTPPLQRTQVNFDNGQNARDLAIRSGNPSGAPEPGAIWFATNTSLYDAVGIPSNIDASNIDVAIVSVNEGQNLLRTVLDGRVGGLPAARSTVLNNFNSRGGLTAGVYQIIQGEIRSQFSPDGQTVQGEMNLIGNGYIEPGQYRYVARFAGQVTQPLQ